LNIAQEALESLLDDLEVGRVEPLEEEGVHARLAESLGDSHDAGAESQELLSRLLDVLIIELDGCGDRL